MSIFRPDNSSGVGGELDIAAPTLSEPEMFEMRSHWSEEKVTPKETTIYNKPLFYSGPVPFNYTAYYSPDLLGGGGGQFFKCHIVLLQDFGQWKNLFVYDDLMLKHSGVAGGAITIDENKNRVAVAKLSKVIKGEGVEIEEYHLNKSGGVMFYCKSHYGFGGGKENEAYAKGKKEAEYYLFWPVSAQD